MTIVFFAGLVGAGLPRLGTLDPQAAAVLGLGGVAAAFLFLRHPRWSVMTMFAGSVFGLFQYEVSIGPIGLRVIDAPFVALVLWAFLSKQRGVRRSTDIGQNKVAILCATMILSLVPLAFAGSSEFTPSFVSLGRLVQALSLIWLVPYAVRDAADREWLVRWIMLLIAAVTLWIWVTAALAGGTDARPGGNTLGLLAAVLIVLALHTRVFPLRSARLAFVVIGLLGLVTSKSIGGAAATGATLGLVGLFTSSRPQPIARSMLLRPASVILLAAGVFGIVSTLRPGNLPNSDEFRTSSSQHRLLLGTAGVEIFLDNPVLGVGWSQSSAPGVIGGEDLSERLRERFEGTREDFFPDVNPSSVHNGYIQVFAEAGLPGGIAMIAALLAVRKRVRHLLSRLAPADRVTARGTYAALVAVLVWFNDSAIFGAQPEALLLGLLIGLLASFAPSRSRDEAPQPARLAAV